MNRQAVRNDLLRKLGFTQPATTPTDAFDDVASAVNWAFQRMWSAPNGKFFRQKERSFNTVSGQSGYSLGADVLELISPVRASDRDLIPITHKGDVRRFAQRYLASDATKITKARGFYLDRLAGSDPSDPIELTILLAPTPTQVEQIDYEVGTVPPYYRACDLNEDTDEFPIPHNFIESLMLPLARWHILQSNYTRGRASQGDLEFYRDGYQTALGQLGLNDPEIDTNHVLPTTPIN